MAATRSRLVTLFAASGASAAACLPVAALAQGGSCNELWQERNAIYARYGYCFQSERAIRTFGRGCFPPYGQLPRGDRFQVEQIQQAERAQGCPS